MSDTQLKSITGESTRNHDFPESIDMNAHFHPEVKFKGKQLLIDKMKSLGEELLAWILAISAIATVIHFLYSLI